MATSHRNYYATLTPLPTLQSLISEFGNISCGRSTICEKLSCRTFWSGLVMSVGATFPGRALLSRIVFDPPKLSSTGPNQCNSASVGRPEGAVGVLPISGPRANHHLQSTLRDTVPHRIGWLFEHDGGQSTAQTLTCDLSVSPPHSINCEMTAVGFEPTPLRTGA